MSHLHPLLLLLSLALPWSGAAQTTLTGLVTDEAGGAIAFANVLLLNPADSTLVMGELTGESGRYAIEDVAPADYLLAITMLGYSEKYAPLKVLPGRRSLDLGTTVLADQVQTLEQIEVTARKPLFEQKIDRLVVNVSSSITSAGSSAFDVLARSPGVVVNRQSNAISMAGKQGVVVMINGKISRMSAAALVQMLKGMNADNIEKIELITTPPANFDAEGNAGFINIVLKRNTDFGLNGSFALNAGYGFREKFGGSLNFNYRSNRFNLFGDYSYAFNHKKEKIDTWRSVINDGVEQVSDVLSRRDPIEQSHNARLGIDLQLSEKTVFGVLLSGYNTRWDMDAFNTLEMFENGQLISTTQIDNDEINEWYHGMGNLNLQHRFDETHSLTLNADYLYYHDNNPTDYLNEYFDGQGQLLKTEELRVRKITPIHFGVFSADYSGQLAGKIRFDAGLKGTLSSFDNDVSVENRINGDWQFDPQYTQRYMLREGITAAYGSAQVELGPKTNLQAGLRYEYTDSQLDSELEKGIVDRQYGNFFPSVFLSQSFNDDHQLNLAYSRRITRPTFNDLAPFVIFLDPSTFFSGNAALQPAITDNLRAEYRWKRYLLSVQYSYEDGAIAGFQPQIDPETNEQLITAVNMDFQQTVSITLSVPLMITPWWEAQNNFIGTWYRNRLSYNDALVTLEQKTLNINSTHHFQLPADFSLEISGFFLSPTLWGITKSKPLGVLGAGLRKELPGEHGALQFNVSDIFLTGNWKESAFLPEQQLNYRGLYAFAERIFRLTYTRNFGNSELKASRDRSTGSEEERRRVN